MKQLNPYFQGILDHGLELCRKQKERIQVPPEQRFDPDKDKISTFTVHRRGKEDGDWIYWIVKKDGIILCRADTEEEAYRMIREEGG